MSPIDDLYEDHRHIMVALDGLDALALQPADEARLEDYERGLAFIQTFADGAHYAKEELLFDALSDLSPAPVAPPIECLRAEHAATEAQTARMAAAIDAIRGGDARSWPILRHAIAGYVGIVRIHLPKENNMCFPAAAQILPAETQTHLGERFAAINAGLPQSIANAAREVGPRGPADAPAAVPKKAPEHSLETLLAPLRRAPPSVPPVRGILRRR